MPPPPQMYPNKAFPDVVGEENVTIVIDKEERPTYVENGPAEVLRPSDSTATTFVQYGFASCPIAFDSPGLKPARILLMRARGGGQPDEFEAVTELQVAAQFWAHLESSPPPGWSAEKWPSG